MKLKDELFCRFNDHGELNNKLGLDALDNSDFAVAQRNILLSKNFQSAKMLIDEW